MMIQFVCKIASRLEGGGGGGRGVEYLLRAFGGGGKGKSERALRTP